MNARDVIRRPLVTEKTMAGMREGRFTFEVDLHANKVEIRKAVEEIWPVNVVAVNAAVVRGKVRRQGANAGKRPDWKKAIVTLREGQTISAFEGLL